LPFGVGAYKALYESEQISVKRSSETGKVNAVAVANLWGD